MHRDGRRPCRSAALGRRVLKADDLPDAKGAYALVLRLERGLRLDIPRLNSPRLPAGLYLYAGSAWGPGGIRARVGRHMRPGKALRWHIDHLTSRAKFETVLTFPGGQECEIVARAETHGPAHVPIPGFGASDCRICAAHLLAIEPALVAALANSDSRTNPVLEASE